MTLRGEQMVIRIKTMRTMLFNCDSIYPIYFLLFSTDNHSQQMTLRGEEMVIGNKTIGTMMFVPTWRDHEKRLSCAINHPWASPTTRIMQPHFDGEFTLKPDYKDHATPSCWLVYLKARPLGSCISNGMVIGEFILKPVYQHYAAKLQRAPLIRDIPRLKSGPLINGLINGII